VLAIQIRQLLAVGIRLVLDIGGRPSSEELGKQDGRTKTRQDEGRYLGVALAGGLPARLRLWHQIYANHESPGRRVLRPTATAIMGEIESRVVESTARPIDTRANGFASSTGTSSLAENFSIKPGMRAPPPET
jgi:hypothetical protein